MLAPLTLSLLLLAQQDQRVYRVGEEGVKAPKLTRRVELKYSEAARDANIFGVVLLSLEVTPEGKPEKIKIIRGLEESLDRNAISAVEQWAFAPATKDGAPVRVKATVEVNFRRL